MRTITLALIEESGLSIDWMTVYIGWVGLQVGFYSFYLSPDEVRDYAWSKLREVQTEEGYAIYRLADSDPTNSFSMRSPLVFLSERSGVTEDVALRKLRYAAITNILRLPYGSTDEDAMIEEAETLFRASRAWNFVP